MAVNITSDTTVDILDGEIIPAGVTKPPLRVRVTTDGEPALERADVLRVDFEMQKRRGDPISGRASFEEPGVLVYEWDAMETAERGVYRGRFTAVESTGDETPIPIERPLTINIV